MHDSEAEPEGSARPVFTVVMPGLVPGIHAHVALAAKTWMAGTSPAMTAVVRLSSGAAA